MDKKHEDNMRLLIKIQFVYIFNLLLLDDMIKKKANQGSKSS